MQQIIILICKGDNSKKRLTSSCGHFASMSRREQHNTETFLFLLLCFPSFPKIFSSSQENCRRLSLSTALNLHCSCRGPPHFDPKTILQSESHTSVFLVNLRGWNHVKKKVAKKDNAEQSDKSKIANWRSLTHFPTYDRAENSTQYRTLASLPEKDNGMVEGNILHLKNHRKNKWFWTNQRLGF